MQRGRPRGSRATRFPVGWRFRDLEIVEDLGVRETNELDKRNGKMRRFRHVVVRHIPCGATRVQQHGWIKAWVRQATRRNGHSRPRVWCACQPAIDPRGYQRAKNSARAAHRVAMERILGRPLARHESVHHINGVRHDNRLENLELWSSYQPCGQRVEDKLAWARELIEMYEPVPSDALALTGACL